MSSTADYGIFQCWIIAPGVNSTIFLRAAYVKIFLCQKITNLKCTYKKAAIETFIWKAASKCWLNLQQEFQADNNFNEIFFTKRKECVLKFDDKNTVVLSKLNQQNVTEWKIIFYSFSKQNFFYRIAFELV